MLLKIENIKKQFKEIKAVDGISFEVEKGEILGLLGPNGAGKSTTISMISTLVEPDAGRILFRGEDIASKPKKIQRNLGFVPQDIALYPTLTGYENLRFWGNAYGIKGQALKAKIDEVSEIIGIKARLKDKVEDYSGGMKRRLNIGAALLHDPELIIMDEPTVGIDPQSRNHILNTVLELNKRGMTIIYTSHYMEEVEFLCSRICVMDNGRVIAQGSKEALINAVDDDERVKIVLNDPDPGVIEEIRLLPYVKEVELSGNELYVSMEKKNGRFGELVSSIDAFTDGIDSIDVIRPNLETVFLNLTGKALRD